MSDEEIVAIVAPDPRIDDWAPGLDRLNGDLVIFDRQHVVGRVPRLWRGPIRDAEKPRQPEMVRVKGRSRMTPRYWMLKVAAIAVGGTVAVVCGLMIVERLLA